VGEAELLLFWLIGDTMGIKIPMKKVPHYFKWVPWTQPVFTADDMGSIGVVSASSYYSDYSAKGALDGVKSGNLMNTTWGTNNSTTGWWKLVLPYKIKITAINFYNGYIGTANKNIQGRFYADTAKTTPIGDAISTPVDSWYLTQIANIPAEGVYTDTLYFEKTGGNAYAGIGELEITATKLVEGSAEDYDFIEYDLNPAIFMRKIPHYWKYAPWTQPVLTSNTSYGEVTYSSVSGTANEEGFNALDGVKSGTVSSQWVPNNSSTGWWQWKLPVKLKIIKLVFYNRCGDNLNITGRFYTNSSKTVPIGNSFSPAATNWASVTVYDNAEGIITDTIYFDKTSGDGYGGIGELEITATKLVEGSVHDYDFIEWGTHYSVFAERILKYFKWAPWTQPVLSANGTLGGSSFAVDASSSYALYTPYKAFNNASGLIGSWCPSDSISNGTYLIFYNPVPLRVASILVKNGSGDNRAMPSGEIYGSDNGTDWNIICSFTNTVQLKNITWNIEVSSDKAYKYHKVLCTSATPSGLLYVDELDITAVTIQEGTADDYDFKEYSL
jgi:hypothetical protein